MSQVLTAIRSHAVTRPHAVALQGGKRSVSYAGLQQQIEKLAAKFLQWAPHTIGLLADNGVDWILADLAALQAGIPVVPLPTFFSAAQMQHTLSSAGIDLVLTDVPDLFCAQTHLPLHDQGIFQGTLHGVSVKSSRIDELRLPPGTQKISFTSGTTDAPKGVCLSTAAMEHVASSLAEATAANPDDRHLCLLPLATLLENIAGVYVPLLSGATCLAPSLREVGLSGSSGLDVRIQLAALDSAHATTAILVPQMLSAQIAAINAGAKPPGALRYLAVGGGSVSPTLFAQAASLGLPVHEGYGLSECASVVALNRPGDNRPGSVGKPLPHVRIEIASDGEIIVHGVQFSGYLGDVSTRPRSGLHSGDIGHVDQDGYLYISGRKKNLIISSFGRNLSPEWVEREILAQRGLMQAAVFGEARSFNVAVIVAAAEMDPLRVDAAMAAVNAGLPDYARVASWIIARAPFTAGNGLLTHNGRPRRAEIAAAYASELDTLNFSLQSKETHGVLRRIA